MMIYCQDKFQYDFNKNIQISAKIHWKMWYGKGGPLRLSTLQKMVLSLAGQQVDPDFLVHFNHLYQLDLVTIQIY